MAARTEAEALRHFTSQVQRAVLRVMRAVVRVGGSGETRSLLLNQGDPAPVVDAPQLALSVLMRVRPERQTGRRAWTARTAAYNYAIEFDGREVLRYDWHPDEPKDADGNGDARHSHRPARPYDADGDLATIGNQDCPEGRHRRASLPRVVTAHEAEAY